MKNKSSKNNDSPIYKIYDADVEYTLTIMEDCDLTVEELDEVKTILEKQYYNDTDFEYITKIINALSYLYVYPKANRTKLFRERYTSMLDIKSWTKQWSAPEYAAIMGIIRVKHQQRKTKKETHKTSARGYEKAIKKDTIYMEKIEDELKNFQSVPLENTIFADEEEAKQAGINSKSLLDKIEEKYTEESTANKLNEEVKNYKEIISLAKQHLLNRNFEHLIVSIAYALNTTQDTDSNLDKAKTIVEFLAKEYSNTTIDKSKEDEPTHGVNNWRQLLTPILHKTQGI